VKAVNDKVTEEALKIEKTSAHAKMKHIFRMEKVKANNKKDIVENPKSMRDRPRWSVVITAKGQVESVERLL